MMTTVCSYGLQILSSLDLYMQDTIMPLQGSLHNSSYKYREITDCTTGAQHNSSYSLWSQPEGQHEC
jgi:hypothetical protein